jgi:hypothetical protein
MFQAQRNDTCSRWWAGLDTTWRDKQALECYKCIWLACVNLKKANLLKKTLCLIFCIKKVRRHRCPSSLLGVHRKKPYSPLHSLSHTGLSPREAGWGPGGQPCSKDRWEVESEPRVLWVQGLSSTLHTAPSVACSGHLLKAYPGPTSFLSGLISLFPHWHLLWNKLFALEFFSRLGAPKSRQMPP